MTSLGTLAKIPAVYSRTYTAQLWAMGTPNLQLAFAPIHHQMVLIKCGRQNRPFEKVGLSNRCRTKYMLNGNNCVYL